MWRTCCSTWYNHIMAVRSMPISDGTSSSQLFREIMKLSTRNLNAILICLASCPGLLVLGFLLEFRQAEHRAQEKRKHVRRLGSMNVPQYERNIHMYYKSNLLFENKVIAKIYILQLMHSVSAKDKDLTVIRIPYRHLYRKLISTHERRIENITTVGTWFYFTDL